MAAHPYHHSRTPNESSENHRIEVPPDDNTPVTTPTDNTPNCASCTDGCSACPTTGACGHTYTSSETNNHKWIYGSCSAGHAFYACQSYSHRSESWACGHTIYVCSPGVHVEERCSGINSNGQRCTYTFLAVPTSECTFIRPFSCPYVLAAPRQAHVQTMQVTLYLHRFF